ncbi:sortase [Pontibacillus yanchengensis]|uniref:Sortase n=2 Tax=Pontibacillus yanchengensis TaxID=462910 RepID=A0A6I4ZYD7_9BACI|nr:sortase [Pontibacillus yanchengensis]MYL52525.1 sortase [Pontibacillus yanchengensis]
MDRDWKIYFTVVGFLVVLMIGFETNVWAKITNSSSGQAGIELNSNQYLNELEDTSTASSNKVKEFTVLNKKKSMDEVDFEIEKEEEDNGIVPKHIKIPAIDVDTDILNVGILDNGQMGVPDDTVNVGWFEPGTKPGNTGNAVMAGHVDSYQGAAVFFYLKDLKKGDEVTVTNKDGEKRTFVVQKLESYPTEKAPIEQIFGKTDNQNLNLITCTGTYNHDKQDHEKRLVVYTELKKEKEDFHVPKPTNVEVNGTFVTWHAVRKEEVIGYRVYESKDGETYNKVASIDSHERKTYSEPNASKYSYYVTSVDEDGNESDPSEKVNGKD